MNDTVMTVDGKNITRAEADEILEKLRPREKCIVFYRFPANPREDRLTYKSIGAVVGLEKAAVCSMYNRAIKRTAFMLGTDIKTAEVFLSIAVPGWTGAAESIEGVSAETGKAMDYIDRCLKTANTYGLTDKEKALVKHALDWALLKQNKTAGGK